MDPRQWQRIKATFAVVVEEPPDRREALLTRLCRDDDQLRKEVVSLLAAHDDTREPLGPESLAASLPVTPPDYAGRRFGAYRILRELGRGGMGAVFLAERADGEFQRQVALKIVGRTFAGDDVLRRFRRERQIHATLNHPHIAHLLDGGVSADGEPFFVMEYVDGVRIDEYCDRHARTLQERLLLMVAVCRAVAHAHERQIIHRDLKPSNILVTEAGVPKLLDFGIARVLDETGGGGDQTLTEYRAFTPEYASPEQTRGAPDLTPATDVFSLGVLLDRLAAAAGTAGQTSPGEPLPRALRLIMAKARHDEPARRYPSASALADDIERVLDGRDVLARPDSLAERALSWAQRRKVPLAAAVLVAAALVAGALGATYSVRGGPMDDAPAATTAAAPSPATPAIRTMAVLPLTLAADVDEPPGGRPVAAASDQALRVGLADAIASRLARIPSLAMRPTSATVPYLNHPGAADVLGRELQVDAVIAGSLRRVGTQLQTTLRFVEVETGRVLWREELVSDLADMLDGPGSLASHVSRAVTTVLGLPPLPEPAGRAATTEAAQDAYLRGTLALATAMRDVTHIFTARDAFELAIRLDPDFALAQAGLANSYTLAGSLTILAPAEAYPRAERAARRALALDPDLATAHVALAEVEADYNWQWSAAEEHLQRALALAPNSAIVHQITAEFLARHGRFAEAAEHSSRSRDLDPTRVNYLAIRALHYYLEHRFDEAIAQSRAALARDPQAYLAYLYLAMSHAALGRPEAGLEAGRQATALTGGAVPDLFVMACNHALLNDRASADALIARLESLARTRYVDPFIFVAVHAYLGDVDRAFAWLDRAHAARSYWLPTIKVHPVVDSLRGDPRFAAMLAKMHLE